MLRRCRRSGRLSRAEARIVAGYPFLSFAEKSTLTAWTGRKLRELMTTA